MGNANMTPSAMLETFLSESMSISTISASALKKASDETIYRLLPLIMIAAERIGANCSMDDRDEFINLLKRFRKRISKNRWTKLRFLLLAQNPCFQTFWDLKPVYIKDAYSSAVNDETFDIEDDEDGNAERGIDGSVKRVQFQVSVDIIDVQSVEFWSHAAHRKDIDSGYAFSFLTITHPFFPLSGAEPENDAAIAESVKVLKVFKSIAHPKLVQLRRPSDQMLISDSDGYSMQYPLVMVKKGDNLMQDSGVMLMFRCFNTIWENDSSLSEKYGLSPYVKPYECIPSSATRGIIEGLSDITSLNDFNWQEWAEMNMEDSDDRKQMLRTSVGAYIANYIIGVRDRHFDNILIQNENTMFHIDYSYVLGDKPPIDGPPISLSPGMEKAYQDVGIWEEFVSFSIDSFTCLRQKADTIVNMAQILFPKAGHAEEDIESFLRGPKSLNTEAGDDAAELSVKTQIMESAEDLGNWFKAYTHDNVVPVWYSLLSDGFPPAKVAMEFYQNFKEQREEQIAQVKIDVDESETVEVRSLLLG